MYVQFCKWLFICQLQSLALAGSAVGTSFHPGPLGSSRSTCGSLNSILMSLAALNGISSAISWKERVTIYPLLNYLMKRASKFACKWGDYQWPSCNLIMLEQKHLNMSAACGCVIYFKCLMLVFPFALVDYWDMMWLHMCVHYSPS